MAFFESPRFPPAISMGAVGGPVFDTEVVAVVAGPEKRNALQAYPRHAWDVSHGVRTQAQFDELRAFFLSMQGRLHGWRFKDWTDFQVTTAQGRVLSLTSTTFQLVKRYTLGAVSFDRRIRKPINGTTAVLVSGSPVAHTIDFTTGIVTIASAPAAATVTWSGEFDTPCRFDTDAMRAEVVSRSASGLVYQWQSIPIVEDPSA